MTAIVVGLSMILAGVLIVRALKIGAQIEPAPWWVSEILATCVLLPAFAGLVAGGFAAIGSWLHSGKWSTEGAGSAGGIVAALAVFAVLWGVMSVWHKRVRPIAPVVPIGPSQSGAQQQTLKKAA
jgi:hypothetical protein